MEKNSKTSGVSRQGPLAPERKRPAPGGPSSFPPIGPLSAQEAPMHGSLNYLIALIQKANQDNIHRHSQS
jgi:hypothetical protein